ncbi:hypothetical protein C3Y87_00105 [Carbonactinospora thermoautotrophica]|uniref:hypothetical protein n=1 Tax=Carbonactinospora thermoautotrophica TaxID=1469144 RepID=UPI002270B377|nr:hypothetical protein [Carbonactinospora thermoautotrophica]MCX9189845.1 hypothetical protein [Carbonactinospora thermoautotrophica]
MTRLRLRYRANGFARRRLDHALAIRAGASLDHDRLDPYAPDLPADALAQRLAEPDPWHERHPTLRPDEGRGRRVSLAVRIAVGAAGPSRHNRAALDVARRASPRRATGGPGSVTG